MEFNANNALSALQDISGQVAKEAYKIGFHRALAVRVSAEGNEKLAEEYEEKVEKAQASLSKLEFLQEKYTDLLRAYIEAKAVA